MKRRISFALGGSTLVLAAIAFSAGADAGQVYYPYKFGTVPENSNRPVSHVGPLEAPFVAPKDAKSGTWTDLVGTLPFSQGPWGPMLLTDGTVLFDDYCTNPNVWYKLTPDKKGQYTTGTWSATATMPSGYTPMYFAQQVLTDGRVIVSGGEYNLIDGNCLWTWTNQGAIYDPTKDTWTPVSPPQGWANIGDAASIILPNGNYMLATCCSVGAEFASGSISGDTVSWTLVSGWSCGGAACDDQEALTSLPNGNLVLVDVWDHGSNDDETWIYDNAAGTWSQGSNTASYLSDETYYSLGPAVLMPSQKVIQFGDNGNNNLFNSKTGKWSVAASFPIAGYDCGNAPAALLPDGNVFVQASPGVFNSPSHFFEFKLTKKNEKKGGQLVQVNDPTEAPTTASFQGNMLDLPTGQVLWDNSQDVLHKEIAVYTPQGKPKASWLPAVSSVSTTLTVGSTANAISGTNFNGFSLGSVYGALTQAATNYPLVRFTNTSTGDVCYARSYGFSTMGVFTSGTTNAEFDIPSSCETGASTLQVIVNGIASAGTTVTLNS